MKTKRMFGSGFYILLIAGLIYQPSVSSAQTIRLEKKWETPPELKEPESVIYDQDNKLFYVSNINATPGGEDGNGFISRVSLDGEIVDLEWVKGLNDPKGLGLFKGYLYVADINNVKVIDVASGKIVNTIALRDAVKINDVTVDEEGTVYISDPGTKRIYTIKDKQSENWLENDVFQRLNGVLAYKNKLYTVDMGLGIFYEINKNTKALTKIAEGLKGSDGIVPYGDDFIISNWFGEIDYVSADGQVEKLLDTKAEKKNTADLTFIPELNMLVIPTFNASTVVSYEVLK